MIKNVTEKCFWKNQLRSKIEPHMSTDSERFKDGHQVLRLVV